MKHYKKILSGLSVLILSLIMTSGIVFADSEVPSITSLTLYGNVDVSGTSNPDQYYIKARIEDWESQPVEIGEFKTSMFHGLFVDPPTEYIGKTIEFVLQNQIVADQTEIFLYKNSDGTTASVWTLPQLRKIDLTFQSTPLPPTPTPTLVPTATPAPIILKPSYFEGRAISNGKTVRDGVEIYAVLDDYVSEPVVVYDGRYFLTIDPILDLAATVTAQNLLLEQIALNSESEEGGGFCSANSDGTGSLGIIGLLLSPMILFGIKKIRRIK